MSGTYITPPQYLNSETTKTNVVVVTLSYQPTFETYNYYNQNVTVYNVPQSSVTLSTSHVINLAIS